MDGVISSIRDNSRKLDQASRSVKANRSHLTLGYLETRGPTNLQMMHVGCPHLLPVHRIPDAHTWMHVIYLQLLRILTIPLYHHLALPRDSQEMNCLSSNVSVSARQERRRDSTRSGSVRHLRAPSIRHQIRLNICLSSVLKWTDTALTWCLP